MIRALDGMRDHLTHLERLCTTEIHEAEELLTPLLRAATQGENRMPVAAVMAVAIALQIGLPDLLTFHPTWLLPVLEGALLIGLVAANPRKIDRESRVLRGISLGLIRGDQHRQHLVGGKADRRPARQHHGRRRPPTPRQRRLDLLDQHHRLRSVVLGVRQRRAGRPPQGRRSLPRLSLPPDRTRRRSPPLVGRRDFVDYLYVSFTNATAFSPTDVMPLTRWAKSLMAMQAGVSLAIGALVVARAVNILK